jgi:chemotaxis protein methyltransferase CheR
MLGESEKTESVSTFLENIAFQKLKRILQESAGLNCSGYRDEYLKRRFEVRLRATSCLTYGKYIIYVKRNPEEIQNLLNDLTINYTLFFRDIDVYLHLEKILLPKLLKSNSVTIWSAGCATGEEPYSLAILAHKVLNIHAANHRVSIIASDIDKDALAKAEKGEYLKKQLNGSTDSFIDRYFTKQGELYKVRDFVKQFVHFEQFDLMNPSPRNNLDLILCRNVMIYFSKEGQQHIHMNFYRALREEGYFITGKAEMLSGEPAQKFMSVDVKCRVYQKPELESTLKTGLLNQPTTSNFIQKA